MVAERVEGMQAEPYTATYAYAQKEQTKLSVEFIKKAHAEATSVLKAATMDGFGLVLCAAARIQGSTGLALKEVSHMQGGWQHIINKKMKDTYGGLSHWVNGAASAAQLGLSLYAGAKLSQIKDFAKSDSAVRALQTLQATGQAVGNGGQVVHTGWQARLEGRRTEEQGKKTALEHTHNLEGQAAAEELRRAEQRTQQAGQADKAKADAFTAVARN